MNRKAIDKAQREYVRMRDAGELRRLPAFVAAQAARFIAEGPVEPDFDWPGFFINLDLRVHPRKGSSSMTTNAERGILSQVIDAKLDAPCAERAAQWLRLAGKKQNGLTMGVQAGVMLEEMCELFDEMTVVSAGGIAGTVLNECSRAIKEVASMLKTGEAHLYFHDRVMALDAMSDVTMTVDGVAYLGGFNKPGYDQRMYDSLFDKFKEDGTPVIKPGGKIGKREGWVEPDPTPFIGELPPPPEEDQPFVFNTMNAVDWTNTFMDHPHADAKVLTNLFAAAIALGRQRGAEEAKAAVQPAEG